MKYAPESQKSIFLDAIYKNATSLTPKLTHDLLTQIKFIKK